MTLIARRSALFLLAGAAARRPLALTSRRPAGPALSRADQDTVAAAGAARADRSLKTVDRAPLRATPLHFVLRNGLDIARDAAVQRVERRPEQALITVRDRTGEADGLLTLIFTGDMRTLSGWRVEPGAGGPTQVFLRDVTTPGSIDPKLFILRDPPRRSGPR